ncbi:MAG: maleylacetate reductase, partial [Solirubrobacteraceae bacterium]|nr:maleylacetate reductase [Solirubrobacteraceae bacterium]
MVDLPASAFRWQDGERLVCFGRDALRAATDDLGDGFTLLTTPRAVAAVPTLERAAARMLEVRPGRVDEIAGELRETGVGDGMLVALGGGRVIDVAKALAAANGPPSRVAAIPTTLSGAEMTRVHRHA